MFKYTRAALSSPSDLMGSTQPGCGRLYACSPPGGTQCPPFTTRLRVCNEHYHYYDLTGSVLITDRTAGQTASSPLPAHHIASVFIHRSHSKPNA